MIDSHFSGRADSQLGPAKRLEAVSPSDDAALPHGPTRGLFVGVGGALRVVDSFGNVVDLLSASAQYHPISVARVLATGTAAAAIVALY